MMQTMSPFLAHHQSKHEPLGPCCFTSPLLQPDASVGKLSFTQTHPSPKPRPEALYPSHCKWTFKSALPFCTAMAQIVCCTRGAKSSTARNG